MTNDLTTLVQKIINEVYNRKPPKITWEGTPYAHIVGVSIDQRGQIGEELVQRVLEDKGCKVHYNPHGLDKDKDWDIIVNDIPIEIKMATIGKDGRMFQHERLFKDAKFEALIMIDIAPHDLYLSCYDYEELDWKKMHRRKNSTEYKFDLSLKNLIKNNCAVKTTEEFFAKYKAMEQKTLIRLAAKKDKTQL